MRKVILLGFIVFCGVCFGQDSKFYYLGKSVNKSKFYLSIHDNDTTNNTYDIWAKRIDPVIETKNKKGKVFKKKGNHSMSLHRIFCREEKIATLYVIEYDGKGNVINKIDYDGFIDKTYIIPESLSETFFNFVCRGIFEDLADD